MDTTRADDLALRWSRRLENDLWPGPEAASPDLIEAAVDSMRRTLVMAVPDDATAAVLSKPRDAMDTVSPMVVAHTSDAVFIFDLGSAQTVSGQAIATVSSWRCLICPDRDPVGMANSFYDEPGKTKRLTVWSFFLRGGKRALIFTASDTDARPAHGVEADDFARSLAAAHGWKIGNG